MPVSLYYKEVKRLTYPLKKHSAFLLLQSWQWRWSKGKPELAIDLMEYYEIVNGARPLSGFYHIDADLFTEMHF